MDRLLGEIAPRWKYVLARALKHFETRSRNPLSVETEVDECVSEELRVLGTGAYLSSVLSNLLSNAYEAWIAAAASFPRAGETFRLLVSVKPGLDGKIVIEVHDDVGGYRDVNSFFLPGNALSVHRDHIQKWGGDLRCGECDDVWTRMALELKSFSLVRGLGDFHHEDL